jgi:hypothetical protein
MSSPADTDVDRERESIVAIADRHRRLQARALALDAVTHADTSCEGPRTDTDTPTFETELVIAPEFDVVPPTVLEAIAACDLGVGPVDPQGSGAKKQLIAKVS